MARRIHALVMQEAEQVTRLRRGALYALRLGYHVSRKAWEDQFAQRSAALSFFTLVNVFPVLVLFLFFLGRSPLFKEHMARVQNLVLGQMAVSGARQVVDDLFRELSNNLDLLASGVSGFLGLLVLIALGTSLMLLVERYLNDIWRAPRSEHNIFVRVAVLWTGLTVFPMLVAASFALSAQLGKKQLPGFFTQFILPYGITVALFFLLYKVVPSVPVRVKPALIAAIASALLWETAKVALGAYVKTVFSHSVIGKLYGSVALVPISMAWIYYSWLIVLFGAELCYALQHLDELQSEARRRWFLDKGATPLSGAAAMAVCAEISRAFLLGRPAPSDAQLASAFGLDPKPLRRWLDRLTEAGYLQRADSGSLLMARAPSSVSAAALAGLYAECFLAPLHGHGPQAENLARAEREQAATFYADKSLETLSLTIEEKGEKP